VKSRLSKLEMKRKVKCWGRCWNTKILKSLWWYISLQKELGEVDVGSWKWWKNLQWWVQELHTCTCWLRTIALFFFSLSALNGRMKRKTLGWRKLKCLLKRWEAGKPRLEKSSSVFQISRQYLHRNAGIGDSTLHQTY
jgi:hypothetical protein